MYIKNTLSYKVRNDLSIFIPNILESIFCEIQLCNKSIIVGTIYTPNTPPKADLDIFTHTIHERQQLNDDNKEIYIMGDMNIDLLQYENHQKTNEYLDNIFSLGCIPLITKPTRITSHSATIIGHIYTNKKQVAATSGILITDISDHFGIFSIIDMKLKKKKLYKCRLSRHIPESSTINWLFIRNWSWLSKHSIQYIHEIIYNIFNTAFPLRENVTKKKNKKHSNWITKGLVHSSNHKHKLLLKKLKQPTQENCIRSVWSDKPKLIILTQKYKQQNMICKKHGQSLKKQQIHNKQKGPYPITMS